VKLILNSVLVSSPTDELELTKREGMNIILENVTFGIWGREKGDPIGESDQRRNKGMVVCLFIFGCFWLQSQNGHTEIGNKTVCETKSNYYFEWKECESE